MNHPPEEIVALMLNNAKRTITTSPQDCIRAVQENNVHTFVSRDRAKMMSAADLGKYWSKLAAAPTLFRIGHDGSVLPPEPQER